MTTSTATAAALFVLRESVVPVLVVDLAEFGGGEAVVGVGYLDELFGGGFIATTDLSGFVSTVLSAIGMRWGKVCVGDRGELRILIGMVFLAQ